MRRRRHSLPAQLLRRVRPSEAVRVVKVSRQALGVGAVVWLPLGPAPLDRLLPVDDTQTFLLSVCFFRPRLFEPFCPNFFCLSTPATYRDKRRQPEAQELISRPRRVRRAAAQPLAGRRPRGVRVGGGVEAVQALEGRPLGSRRLHDALEMAAEGVLGGPVTMLQPDGRLESRLTGVQETLRRPGRKTAGGVIPRITRNAILIFLNL